MKNNEGRRLYWIAGLVAAAGLAGWVFFAPEPIPVETAQATRGPLEVTVDQEGEVRVHDRYEVAAPVAGKLVRVALRDGDAVRGGDVVAELEPAPLDPRAREEAIARVEAARAAVREAGKRVEQAAAVLAQARSELARVERLVAERFVSPEAAEKARTAVRTAVAELEAASAREAAARSEEKVAQAALLALPSADGRPGRVMKITAPVSGRVLRVLQQSERTVPAGTPVMVIGDPARFEIVADVLSSDAVKIRPGATAWLEEWGGDRRLRATVRLVEPYAFTKVSALGIEEKRVNVVMDPVDPLGPLGDGYRVEARIVVWSAPDVLKVPASALFRSGEGWAVFAVADGRARERRVEVGARNAREAEIRSGLAAGETVIKYPTNEVADGVRVVAAKR
ncbi:MAG: efflux RND transporter periplasmic adaptor subunit [Burkholderiales bacterium]|nr:efflux RND transporter periplasmic adaptor subunit [Burkholderiales bacterium]